MPTAAPQAPPGPGQVRGLTHLAGDLVGISTGLLAYNFAYLASAWILAIGAIALFWLEPAWYTFMLAFLVVSSRQQALLNVEHECAHGKFVGSRRGNELIGTWLSGAAVGSPFAAAQARHLSHHRLLGTADDPDRHLHNDEAPRDSRLGLLGYFARALLGAYALMVLFDPPEKSVKAGRSPLQMLLPIVVVQAALFAALTPAFAWWVYPALWLAPLASLTTLSHLVRSYTEHAISEDERPGHSNRLITIQSNRLERGIVSPYFMNYHAEHHLLPSVPAPRLPELQGRLGEEASLPPIIERPSYAAALRRMFAALKR